MPPRTVLLLAALASSGSGCTSTRGTAPASTDLRSATSRAQPPAEEPAPSPPLPTERPWAFDRGALEFGPPGGGPHVFMRNAAQAREILSSSSGRELSPLAITVPAERLCEVADVVTARPHGTLALDLYGNASAVDPACLTRLGPAYLSYGPGPRQDYATEQHAYFALLAAVPELVGFAYDGYGGTIHQSPPLHADELAELTSATSLQAVVLDRVILTEDTATTLATLPRLRSLELRGSKVTPSLLRPVADARPLERLVCDDCPLGDTGMVEVAKLSSLAVLELDGAGITDAGMAQLAGLHQLERLDLTRNTRVTNAGVAHLAELVKLRHLALSTLHIDSDALPHLAKLTALETLMLDRTTVGDANLEVLARMTRLEQLDLWATSITNASAPVLGSLQQLRSLVLEDTRVDDEILPALGRLTELRILILSETDIDGQLESLSGLTRLEQLWLTGTNVDDADVERLPALLPSLRSLDVSFSLVSQGLADRLRTDTLEVTWIDPSVE